jgi:hypothetical protein
VKDKRRKSFAQPKRSPQHPREKLKALLRKRLGSKPKLDADETDAPRQVLTRVYWEAEQ